MDFVYIIVGFQNSIEAPLFHLPVVAFHTNQKLWILQPSLKLPILNNPVGMLDKARIFRD